ncbi:MAG: Hcp family type VI secretion system effector [Gemmatimonadota bacterium]
MLKRASLAAVAAASVLLLIPALPGAGDAQAQMTMNLASAGRGPGVNAIVEGYTHAVIIPEDAATARATGRRVHKPFTVRKRVDAATPLLYRALTNSETIPAVTLRLPTTNVAGGPTLTITLTDARIMTITSGSSGDDLPVEEVAFYYNKIQWTYSEGGISHEDSWAGDR